jgi:hypothetical protein
MSENSYFLDEPKFHTSWIVNGHNCGITGCNAPNEQTANE